MNAEEQKAWKELVKEADPCTAAGCGRGRLFHTDYKPEIEVARRAAILAADAALTRLSALEERCGDLEWAIEDCVAHYPEDIFPEPSKEDFAHLHQRKGASERLHGSWARHLVKVIRENAAIRAKK